MLHSIGFREASLLVYICLCIILFQLSLRGKSQLGLNQPAFCSPYHFRRLRVV